MAERTERCDVLALKMEEGASSQSMGVASEAGKDKETKCPQKP